mmetsp:Transcript_40390/g.101060  ORF Transcript_40390/g.101060 Transcript_40390/m.101060 type:complete len:212 (-) Transcript_40390:348-983(-)
MTVCLPACLPGRLCVHHSPYGLGGKNGRARRDGSVAGSSSSSLFASSSFFPSFSPSCPLRSFLPLSCPLALVFCCCPFRRFDQNDWNGFPSFPLLSSFFSESPSPPSDVTLVGGAASGRGSSLAVLLVCPPFSSCCCSGADVVSSVLVWLLDEVSLVSGGGVAAASSASAVAASPVALAAGDILFAAVLVTSCRAVSWSVCMVDGRALAVR